jgi:CRISPR-associated protein (TIGR02710 family)
VTGFQTFDDHHLLICTVGGSPEPIISAVRHWKPDRVHFITSPQSKGQVQDIKVGSDLGSGAFDVWQVPDPQNFNSCVKEIRLLEDRIHEWLNVAGRDVIVDFTGGTKCMSAALTLVARRWPCTFSYVGGSERTKGGVGIVLSGKEQIVRSVNPSDALGYQAIEDACLLFDRLAFLPAKELLKDAMSHVERSSTKRTIATLSQLCEAYAYWDRFDHVGATNCLRSAIKNEADLKDALGPSRTRAVIATVERNEGQLETLREQRVSRALLADLIANAKRRSSEGRYDDAVARLYRAIEATAQLALAEFHDIPSTDGVPISRVPESLRASWSAKAENGQLRLGLQDAYELLDALEDQAGKTFRKLGLDAVDRSPLAARNQSILAHGFRPVGRAVVDQLFKAALQLSGLQERDLPEFPRFSASDVKVRGK